MSKSLCVTLWNWTTNNKPSFSGGVKIPLHSRQIATVKPKFYQLTKDMVRKTRLTLIL